MKMEKIIEVEERSHVLPFEISAVQYSPNIVVLFVNWLFSELTLRAGFNSQMS